MSRAISTVGFLPGTLLICLFGFASAFGLHLLSRCAVLCGRASSFNLLSKLTYPRAALIFDLAIAIKCFGVAVSYLVLIGELMPAAMDDLYDVAETHLLRSRRFWISAFMAVIVPTSFLRRLDVLKYTSFLALTAILYIFVLAVYYFFEDVDPATGMLRRAEDTRLARVPDMEFVEYLSVFVFAFTCHQNIFSVYNEMRRNTMQRMNGVIGSSIGTATAIYIVVGSAGYAMYGGTAKSNVIMNCRLGKNGRLYIRAPHLTRFPGDM